MLIIVTAVRPATGEDVALVLPELSTVAMNPGANEAAPQPPLSGGMMASSSPALRRQAARAPLGTVAPLWMTR